jgi:uncharacterized protein YkwD
MRKPLVVAGTATAVLLAGAGPARATDTRPVPALAPVTAAGMSPGPAPSVQVNVLTLVNERRRRAGCGPLSLDRRLSDAAGEHAADMARHGYFAHASRNGDDPGDRVRDAGFRWRRYGENIARGAGSPDQVVRDWMRSPEHRGNILDCRLREMGVGLARSPRRGAYWVQDFATP